MDFQAWFMKWSLRLPDMNPLDNFLWCHLKNIVYDTTPANIQELNK